MMSKMAFIDAEHAARVIEQAKTAGTIENVPQSVTPQSLVDFIHSDEYTIEFSRNESMKSMMEVAPQIAAYLAEANWKILHSGERRSFVTCDDPFLLVGPRSHSQPFGVGIMTPGSCTKILPLSATTAVEVGDRGDNFEHFLAGQQWVRRVNLNLAVMTNRFLIARDEPLLRSVVRASAIYRAPEAPRKFGFGNDLGRKVRRDSIVKCSSTSDGQSDSLTHERGRMRR